MADTATLLLAVQNAELLRDIAGQAAPRTTSQVAQAIGRDPSNVRKSLEKLAEHGLIQKDWAGVTELGRAYLDRLDVLEGRAPAEGPAPADGLAALPHNQIEPDPDNPRTVIDRADLMAFAEALKARIDKGLPPLLQNLVVHKGHGGPLWRLAAGERRWRAIGRLIAAGDLPSDYPLPVRKLAFIEATETRDRLFLALEENMQRADLNRIDEANAYRRLLDEGADTAEIAARAQRSRRHVQQHLQLLELSPEDQARVRTGELGFKAALAMVQEHQEPAKAPARAPEPEEAAAGADHAAAASDFDGAVRDGKIKAKDLLQLIELADAVAQKPHPSRRQGPPVTRIYSGNDHPSNGLVLFGVWGEAGGGQDGWVYGVHDKALRFLAKHGLLPTSANRAALLPAARYHLVGASTAARLPEPTPYWTPWLNPPETHDGADAASADRVNDGPEGAAAARPPEAVVDTARTEDGDNPARASGEAPPVNRPVPAAFSVSTPASGARPDPETLAAALTADERVLLGEVGWAARRIGTFVADDDGRMARCFPAGAGLVEPAVRRLAGGMSIATDEDGGRARVRYLTTAHNVRGGPMIGLTEDGRAALQAIAPDLANLDRPEDAARDDLDGLWEAAGYDSHARLMLRNTRQLTRPWIEEAMRHAHAAAASPSGEDASRATGAGAGEASEAGAYLGVVTARAVPDLSELQNIAARGDPIYPIDVARALGVDYTPPPEPIFALYEGDVVEISGGAHYRLIHPMAHADGADAGFLAQQVRKSRRGKGEGSDYGDPRQITLASIVAIASRSSAEAPAKAEVADQPQPEKEPA